MRSAKSQLECFVVLQPRLAGELLQQGRSTVHELLQLVPAFMGLVKLDKERKGALLENLPKLDQVVRVGVLITVRDTGLGQDAK